MVSTLSTPGPEAGTWPVAVRGSEALRDGGGEERFPDRHQLGAEGGVGLQLALDLLDAVHHRRVVAAAQIVADLGQGDPRLLAQQVHRDLTREDDLLRPGATGK